MNDGPRRYRTGDFDELARWCVGRKMRPLDPAELPQIGFVVPGLAAGFLYLTDSHTAFAGGLLSNPDAPMLARARAASTIVDRLLEEGRACGFKYVAVTCSLESTKKLSRRKGFVTDGAYELLFKEV